MRSLATLLLVLACVLASVLADANFDACKRKVQGIIDGSIPDCSSFDIIYHGKLRGFNVDSGPRPRTLTYDGCREVCGDGTNLNDVLKAFQILTTWVLPAVALLSQLPYESLSEKKRKNVEAFVNLVGAPASALTTTIFNVHLIKKAQRMSSGGRGEKRDAYFVLTCINQYQYPGTLEEPHRTRRDQAVFYGLLRPLAKDASGNPIQVDDVAKTRVLLENLAFQLRLQHRRGVWRPAINILWF